MKGDEKRAADNTDDHDHDDDGDKKIFESDDSIPFTSIKQMLPGYLENSVIKAILIDIQCSIL